MNWKQLSLTILLLLITSCGGKQAAKTTATAEYFQTVDAALTQVAQVPPTRQPTWTPSPFP